MSTLLNGSSGLGSAGPSQDQMGTPSNSGTQVYRHRTGMTGVSSRDSAVSWPGHSQQCRSKEQDKRSQDHCWAQHGFQGSHERLFQGPVGKDGFGCQSQPAEGSQEHCLPAGCPDLSSQPMGSLLTRGQFYYKQRCQKTQLTVTLLDMQTNMLGDSKPKGFSSLKMREGFVITTSFPKIPVVTMFGHSILFHQICLFLRQYQII